MDQPERWNPPWKGPLQRSGLGYRDAAHGNCDGLPLKSIASPAEVIRLIEEPTDDNHSIHNKLMNDTRTSALVDAWELAETAHAREILCEFYAFRRAKSALPVLLQGLSDKEPAVRAAAAHALGNLRLSQAGPPLLVALHNETDVSTRRWLASALGACGYAAGIDDLIALLDDDDELVRTQATWALGELGAIKAKRRLSEIDPAHLSDWDQKILREALQKIK